MSWIKLREDLEDDPATVSIAKRCTVTAAHAVGKLARAWSWAGRLSRDGRVPFATPQMLDDVVRMPGLAEAMAAVGWLEIGEAYLLFPNWDRHNSSSAKERALGAERIRKHRETGERDEPVTHDRYQRRGEEKREEKSQKKPEPAPGGSGGAGAGERENGPRPKASKPRKEAAGPHPEAIRAWETLWADLRGEAYVWTPKEATSVAKALKLANGDVEAFIARARRLLEDPPDPWYAQNGSPSLLAERWNQLAVRVVRRTPTLDERNRQTLLETAEELLREA